MEINQFRENLKFKKMGLKLSLMERQTAMKMMKWSLEIVHLDKMQTMMTLKSKKAIVR